MVKLQEGNIKMKGISLKQDAESVLKEYDKMESYRIQENILQCLKNKYPNHSNKNAVDIKVKLLNMFYSTGIQATNAMTKNILAIKDIDCRLVERDYSLVNEIATLRLSEGKERYNYSFATKYCAYHQPEKFPIYDSIVTMMFTSFFEKGLLPKFKHTKKKTSALDTYTKKEFSEKLKNYHFFVTVYDYFMDLYDLKTFTYRQVDSYIWGAFKIAGEDYEIEKMANLDKSKIIEYSI